MFLDWIQASQDNYDMWYYGIKGKHFNLTADGVVEYIGTADNTALPYNPTPWWFRNYKMDRSVSTDCDMTKTAQDYWKNATVLPVSPTAAFAFDINPVNLQVTQVIAVVQQYWNDLANGVLQGDDNYQTFLKALNDAGMPDIITEMQKQLDKYRADHSIN
jgi:putative aldouronate transport system substrate-binding protein